MVDFLIALVVVLGASGLFYLLLEHLKEENRKIVAENEARLIEEARVARRVKIKEWVVLLALTEEASAEEDKIIERIEKLGPLDFDWAWACEGCPDYQHVDGKPCNAQRINASARKKLIDKRLKAKLED